MTPEPMTETQHLGAEPSLQAGADEVGDEADEPVAEADKHARGTLLASPTICGPARWPSPDVYPAHRPCFLEQVHEDGVPALRVVPVFWLPLPWVCPV